MSVVLLRSCCRASVEVVGLRAWSHCVLPPRLRPRASRPVLSLVSPLVVSPSPKLNIIRTYAGEASGSRVKDLRKAVNQLLLKVHPDFFRHEEKISKINEESLSALNAFIDVVEQNVDKGFFRLLKTKVPEKFRVRFFLKREKTDMGFTSIRCDYQFPASFFTVDTPSKDLEREAIIYLNQLLTQAGLEPLELPKEKGYDDFVSRPYKVDNQEVKQQQQKPVRKQKMKQKREDPTEIMLDAMKKQMDPEFSLTHWKHQMTTESEMDSNILKSEDSLWLEHERQLFYAPSLSIPQRAEAWRHLRSSLKDIGNYPEWSDLPILFTNNNTYMSPKALPGFLTIPHNFNLNELKEYLEKNLVEIREERRKIRAKIYTARFLTAQIQESLRLMSVEVRLWYDEALFPLQEMYSHLEDLEPFYLDGFSFIVDKRHQEVTFDFHLRVIFIPHDIEGPVLVGAVKEKEADLKRIYLQNPYTAEHLGRVFRICDLLRHRLGCVAVLMGHKLSDKKFLQFTALSNLIRRVDILLDRARKRLYIPYQFSEEQFLAFLHRNLGAKSKQVPSSKTASSTTPKEENVDNEKTLH